MRGRRRQQGLEKENGVKRAREKTRLKNMKKRIRSDAIILQKIVKQSINGDQQQQAKVNYEH